MGRPKGSKNKKHIPLSKTKKWKSLMYRQKRERLNMWARYNG